jgi:hypothetical protein
MNLNGNNSENYGPKEVPPVKTYPARLYGIYDIGEHKKFESEETEPKILLAYELLGKERKSDGSTFKVFEEMKQSLHVKAKLTARLITFKAPVKQKNENWYEIDPKYALTKLLGLPCMLSSALTSGGSAKVGNVIEPIDGLVIPELESEIGFLDLSAPDAYDQLCMAPNFIKRKVGERFNPKPIKGEPTGAGADQVDYSKPPVNTPAPAKEVFEDDEIF